MRRLERFLRDWADLTHPLHQAIGELWLEFDSGSSSAAPNALPPLSLFAALNDVTGRDGFELATDLLDTLAPAALSARWRANLERCFVACPDGAFVSHIGLMLGRPVPFVRVNVKRLEPATLRHYLGDVGWPGPLEAAVELLARARPLVDRITACLDLGDGVAGHLGLECAIDGQPETNRRWDAFLAALVEWNLCQPAKRDGLLRWPGVTTPPDTEAPWPAPLIRAELLRGADHFTSFERRLSHVKVTMGARGREAKAYFGFFHSWQRPGLDSEPAASGRILAVRHRAGPAATAAARAITFLLTARSRSGWWRDFSGVLENGLTWRAGSSDEWVTAFIAAALAGRTETAARRAAREAWDLLRRRRPPGAGWGYNRLMPSDADSTAWALRLAAAVGDARSPHARGARSVLAGHLAADGGLTTYTRQAFEHSPPERRSRENAYAGWAATSHVCVTAAGAPALGDERPLEFLRRSQRPDGRWCGYWWADPEYTTALAGEALAGTGRATDSEHVHAATAWALDRLAGDGSAGASGFATAWCVRLLTLVGDASSGAGAARGARRRATAWLLKHQQDDGSWASSARLMVPQPDVRDSNDSLRPATRTFDDARVFTTAAVLSALPIDPP